MQHTLDSLRDTASAAGTEGASKHERNRRASVGSSMISRTDGNQEFKPHRGLHGCLPSAEEKTPAGPQPEKKRQEHQGSPEIIDPMYTSARLTRKQNFDLEEECDLYSQVVSLV